jgi:tripartite-type tricarboxylate transporter receptor subunit TctC
MSLKSLTISLLAAVTLIGGTITGSYQAAAAWKPSGPVKLQIGFGAGGETDTLGRAIAAVIEEQTGWDVIAENKPGGGGIAMFSGISKAKPDGQVVGMGVSMPVLINLVLRGDKLPFKLDSFDYLATVTRAQLAIIAKADAPYNNMSELVAYSKSKGGVPIGFDAKPQELILRAINKSDGAGFRPVSGKSSAEMIQEVLGGHVAASFAAGIHIQYLKSGDLKMLASANDGRHSYAPDVPTLREQGYDLFVDPWFYIAAPAGLPADAKAAWTKALDNAIKAPKVRDLVAKAMQNETINLGADGTKKMMNAGIGGVKVLFGK